MPTLTVSLGAASGSFKALFSLTDGTGTATWSGSTEPGWVHHHRRIRRTLTLEPLSAAELTLVRDFAAKMEERGDYTYRDQFAQAGIGVALSGEPPIQWSYDVDGGLPGEANPLYDLASERVWEAVRAQKAEEDGGPALIPDVPDETALLAIHRKTEPWLPAVERVATRHGLAAEGWARAADGSQVVLLCDHFVLKFYVPFWPATIDAEEAALALVRWDFPVATPPMHARGVIDGWEYIVFRKVEGIALHAVRDQMSPEEELDLAQDLGRVMRHLHDIKVPKDSCLRENQQTWRAFLSTNRAQRGELELARGTSAEWVDRVVGHLKSWRYRKRGTSTFIHADITDEHVLLNKVDGAWKLHALVDFGDVKIGDAAYEFAAPFVSWMGQRPDLRRAMLNGYGRVEEGFLDRVFESILLHEFACLGELDLNGLTEVEQLRARYCDLQ